MSDPPPAPTVSEGEAPLAPPVIEWSAVPELLRMIRQRTPARILTGRCGSSSYSTSTQLELRHDHAFAVDAVHAELHLERDLGAEIVARWRLFEIQTRAGSKSEYLMRPDLGRLLGGAGRAVVLERCPAGVDLQVVVGDGLSTAAIARQVPFLLPLLHEEAGRRGWSLGQPFVIRHCRVGILNEIGQLLDPQVVVLLIGERPGLATAESLSAYMAYRPRSGHTDAQRNLISNIHGRGVPLAEAARRIMALAEKMRSRKASGIDVREELTQKLENPQEES